MKFPQPDNLLELIFPEVVGAVITSDKFKNINLCPITFQAISTKFENPPTVCIGLNNEHKTLSNILDIGQFVYAYPSKEQLKDIIYCGTETGNSTNKLVNTSLNFSPSDGINPPNLSKAIINFECILKHHYVAGDFTIVIGEITHINSDEEQENQKIYELGGMNYGTLAIDNILQEGR